MADPLDPKLAEALNPRLALAKRMAAEGQQPPALPDSRIPASGPAFTKKWSPEERARQNAQLAKLLSSR
jgi:hypothetical protein